MLGRKIFCLLACLMILGSSTALAEDLPVTSSFGWRVHPISGAYKFHSGVDLGYPSGTGILALFDGVVVDAGNFNDGYGNQVLIYEQADDTFTRYAHCSEVYVSAGEAVQARQVIAAVGSTGNSTGSHLHLEYIVPGEGGYQYADPLALF